METNFDNLRGTVAECFNALSKTMAENTERDERLEEVVVVGKAHEFEAVMDDLGHAIATLLALQGEGFKSLDFDLQHYAPDYESELG